jgi:hypothetical protein
VVNWVLDTAWTVVAITDVGFAAECRSRRIQYEQFGRISHFAVGNGESNVSIASSHSSIPPLALSLFFIGSTISTLHICCILSGISPFEAKSFEVES